mmetsp:Transcript_10629/g.22862  ORF Transcript_10629/g.22862 Transcript_10629/m.22862 type:complete len:361 (+) Transcript_10629:81-1163(+)|eukprot:CAMPEP_0183729524 /NCGR_PEP_ID=MMETSP0737-20130205/30537_1 /TAXON_ID=385413 /ORGANISM="Thalassiosira miniscula, Strain CCMP1093" /LENGTH=360 /DNA_ID=CAMNT_0025961737 /DNA_START=57 /DNA_END=1139 /DNA_ORIENTATION=-
MKSPLPNLVCMTVLLSSSVMSSSFSSSPRLFGGRARVGSSITTPLTSAADRLALLRGGSDVESAVTAPLPPPADAGAAAASSSSSTAISATVSGGDAEEASSPSSPDTSVGPSSTSSSSSSSSKLGPNAPPPGLLRRTFPSFPWHSLPNYLTYARCLSIPLFMILSYYPTTFPNRAPVLSLIFALASITDWFDGFLARRWDITSAFGAFLDPVADKLMVSTALITLAGRYGGIVAVPSSIIMAREVGVSALREWMAQQGKRDSVKVGMQGKIKTALTMAGLTLLLLVPDGVGLDSVSWTKFFGPLGVGGAGASVAEGVVNAGWSWMLGPSLIMLFASAVVTVTSGSVYFRAAWPVLSGKE